MNYYYSIIVYLLANVFTSELLAQTGTYKPSKVDFDSYEKLVLEVKSHRKERLISLDSFNKFSLDSNTIVLDTRSDSMYKSRHIKGAIHLNFSDFTEQNLAKIIKNKNVRILIYCNNNISGDRNYFPTKAKVAVTPKETDLMLALNVPTYINLYGFGYKNVYELAELVNYDDSRIVFEGLATYQFKLIERRKKPAQ